MISPRFTLPLLCGLLACLSWSIGSVLSKVALSTVEPLTLLVGQLAVSSLSLSALSIWLGASMRLSDWRVGLPGLLQPALAYSLSTYGLTMVPATAESMLFAVETPSSYSSHGPFSASSRTARSACSVCWLSQESAC